VTVPRTNAAHAETDAAAPTPASDAPASPIAHLARSACDRWGLDGAAIALLHHRENAVFRIDAASGERFVLRVHRPGYQTRASVRSELTWTDALRDSGVESPAALPARDGERVQEVTHAAMPEPRLCVLFRWVEGSPLAGAVTAAAFETLGAVNARLHRQAETWSIPSGFERQRWDLEGMLGERALWGRFGDLGALAGEARRICARAADVVREDLSRYGADSDRFGLIHADLMPDNVLVHAGVPRIIDFDDCGFGWFLYDLATLLVPHEGRAHHDEAFAAWLRGYRAVRPLDDAHLAHLPALSIARRLVVLGWLHTRRDAEIARAVTDGFVRHTCTRAEAFLAGRKS
jgi:Ser/Thr protein kinase RdoA (MazF antagonist)